MSKKIRDIIRNIITGDGNNYEQPDRRVRSFLEVTKELLVTNKIKKLILDVDQTIVVHGTSTINRAMQKHIEDISAYIGKQNIVFLTNEDNPERNREIANQTGISIVVGSKPMRESYERALNLLGAKAGKEIATVGDRTWTDIYGGNRMGLFTIQTRPLSPPHDTLLIAISRKLEQLKQQLKWPGLFSTFLIYLTLAGSSLLQFIAICCNIIENLGQIPAAMPKYVWLIHVPFIITTWIIYAWTVHWSAKKPYAASYSQIVRFFNTYPLLFRVLLTYGLLILPYVEDIYRYFSASPMQSLGLPANLQYIGIVYSFYFHASLLLSLSKYYHRVNGRYLRVIIDLVVIWVISSNLPLPYSSFSLITLLIPIGTAARYFTTAGLFIILSVCSGITYVVFTSQAVHIAYSLLLSLIYFFAAGALRVEYRETTSVMKRLLSKLMTEDVRRLDIKSSLRMLAEAMNCQAVFIVQGNETGQYYINGRVKETGALPKFTCEEMHNYLSFNPNCLISEFDLSSCDIGKKEENLYATASTVLGPFLPEGINSILAAQIPHQSQHYLLCVNRFTRNGVASDSFSFRHIPILQMFAFLFSLR